VVGAPCFSRGAGLQSSGKNRFIAKDWALALDFFAVSAKAHGHSRTLSRNAEALLPSPKAEGFHLARGVDLRFLLWFSRRLFSPELCWDSRARLKSGLDTKPRSAD
jgi:hypothetical protein